MAVLCLSGMRSYLTLPQLVQVGLDAANLSGGLLTLRAEAGLALDDVLVR